MISFTIWVRLSEGAGFNPVWIDNAWKKEKMKYKTEVFKNILILDGNSYKNDTTK